MARPRPKRSSAHQPDATEELVWLAQYDARAFPPFAVRVDIALFTIREGALCALLIRRAGHPERGRWALPGGHIRHGRESAEIAARRELEEETGIHWPHQPVLEQLATYSDPRRDPRIATDLQVVTVAFVALATGLSEPVASTDASEARWCPLSSFDLSRQRESWLSGKRYRGAAPGLAFDHAVILYDGLERVRSKLEYTTLATRFVTEPFSLGDLRAVYATVWGYQPDVANFRRKVLATPGFVVAVPAGRREAGPAGGRPPALYRRGDAEWIVPPMLRDRAGAQWQRPGHERSGRDT